MRESLLFDMTNMVLKGRFLFCQKCHKNSTQIIFQNYFSEVWNQKLNEILESHLKEQQTAYDCFIFIVWLVHTIWTIIIELVLFPECLLLKLFHWNDICDLIFKGLKHFFFFLHMVRDIL